MQKLIEALLIFAKYTDASYPTHCEHDELYVMVDPEIVSTEDIEKLGELGFEASRSTFISYRYGSA